MTSPEISIIVPVFNCREFLDECVASLVRQDFGEPYEIILIDDGSTDGSDAICANLAKQYPDKIRWQRFANGGLSVARNRGLEMATGKYITFVDADDGLAPYALSVLHSMLRNNPECGIAIAQYINSDIYPFGTTTSERPIKIFDSLGAIIDALYQRGACHTSAWGKLYRRDLFSGSKWFKPGTWYEDLEFFPKAFSAAKNIAVTETPVYFYRSNPQSFLHKWSEGRLDVLAVTKEIEDWADAQSAEMAKAARSRRFSANYNMFVLACRHNRRDVAAQCWEVLQKGAREAITDRNVRLKNRMAALLCPMPFPVAYALFNGLSRLL